MSPAWRGTIAVLLSACCFGTISPLTVLATGEGMALESIQAWRYITSAVLLVLWAAWRTARDRSGNSNRNSNHNSGSEGAVAASPSEPAVFSRIAPWYTPRILVPTGGGQALVATLALAALNWLPAATASFLFYTYPAWVAIITAVRGIERMDRVRLVALTLSLVGVAAMVGAPDTGQLHVVGVVVILSAALVYALYIPWLAHVQHARAPLDVARAIAVGGALCFVVWAVLSRTLWQIPSATAFGASVLQGALGAVSFVGFLAGLRHLGAVKTAITSTVEPFWTTMLGVVMLGQPLGRGTMVGGALIMAAVLLLQRPSRQRPSSDPFTRGVTAD